MVFPLSELELELELRKKKKFSWMRKEKGTHPNNRKKK